MIVARVSSLFFSCSPTAIIWAISRIVVDSLNRQFFCITVGQRPVVEFWVIIPLLANSYAAGSVIFMVWIIFIQASMSHVIPYLIKTGSFAGYSGKTVNCMTFTSYIATQAATTFGMTVP